MLVERAIVGGRKQQARAVGAAIRIVQHRETREVGLGRPQKIDPRHIVRDGLTALDVVAGRAKKLLERILLARMDRKQDRQACGRHSEAHPGNRGYRIAPDFKAACA